MSLLASGNSFSLSAHSPPVPRSLAESTVSLRSGSIALLSDRVSLNGERRASECGVVARTVRLASFDELFSRVTEPSWVGQGAQGAVLKAQWRSGCTVAVKWLVSGAAEVPAAVLEALLARMMAHPYLVQTFEAAICRLEDGWDCQGDPPEVKQQQQRRPEPGQNEGSGEAIRYCGGVAPVAGSGGPATPTGAPAAERAAVFVAAATFAVPAAAAPLFIQDPPATSGIGGGSHGAGKGGDGSAGGPSGTSGTSPSPRAPLTPPSFEVLSPFESAMALPADEEDSFDGDAAAATGQRSTDCCGVLRQLGAAAGKYVVQIVSEWCDEGTLHAAIRRGVFRPGPGRSRNWALRALLRTAREVALGMCHLHSLGVIHGDLKPGNVLLKSSRVDSRGFVAKVADFGLSRLLRGPQEEFVATSEWGTVPYMAGEYLDNRLCRSSDVYSFGVLLWQMYTGKAPFAGHLEAQVAVGVLMGTLALEWPPGMPPPLLRLGQACCRHEPEQRPTFKEVAVALAGIELQVREASARAKHARRHASGHIGLAAGAGAVASGGAVAWPGPGYAAQPQRGATHTSLLLEPANPLQHEAALLRSATQPPQGGATAPDTYGRPRILAPGPYGPAAEPMQLTPPLPPAQPPLPPEGQAVALPAGGMGHIALAGGLAMAPAPPFGGDAASASTAVGLPAARLPLPAGAAPPLPRGSPSFRTGASATLAASRLHVCSSCADALTPPPGRSASAAAAHELLVWPPPGAAGEPCFGSGFGTGFSHAVGDFGARAGRLLSGVQAVSSLQRDSFSPHGWPEPLGGLGAAAGLGLGLGMGLGMGHASQPVARIPKRQVLDAGSLAGGPDAGSPGATAGGLMCTAGSSVVALTAGSLAGAGVAALPPRPSVDMQPAAAPPPPLLGQFLAAVDPLAAATGPLAVGPRRGGALHPGALATVPEGYGLLRASSLPGVRVDSLGGVGDCGGAGAYPPPGPAGCVVGRLSRGASLPVQLPGGGDGAAPPLAAPAFERVDAPAPTPSPALTAGAQPGGALSALPCPGSSGVVALQQFDRQRAATDGGFASSSGAGRANSEPRAARISAQPHSAGGCAGSGAAVLTAGQPAAPTSPFATCSPPFPSRAFRAGSNHLSQRSIAGSAPGPVPGPPRRARSGWPALPAGSSPASAAPAIMRPLVGAHRGGAGLMTLPTSPFAALRGGGAAAGGGAAFEDAVPGFSCMAALPLAPLQEAIEGPNSNYE